MKRLRRLLGALLALLAIPLLALALLLGVEFKLPLDGQRETIAHAASQALGAEVRLAGELRLYTGERPGIEVGGLHIAGEWGGRRISVDSGLTRLRLGWHALLAHEIRVSEATVEDAKVCVSTAADAPPAKRVPAAEGAPSPRADPAWRLTGIDKLRIERFAVGTVEGAVCAEEHRLAELELVELSAPEGEASRIDAKGRIAGEPWRLDLRGPTLRSLADASAPVPLELAAQVARAKLNAKGRLLRSPLSMEADVVFDSPQLAALIRPLGAPFKDFGPLLVRAQVRADAGKMTLRIDEARLAPVVAGGEFSFDWSGPRPRLAVRARAATLDALALQRWLSESIDPERLRPGKLQRSIVAGMRASEGSLLVEAGQLVAGRVAFDAVAIDGTWREGKGQGSIGARLGESAIKGTFDADVRSDDLALALAAAAPRIALPDGLGTGIAATAGAVDATMSVRVPLGTSLGRGLRATVDVKNAELAVPRDGGATLPITVDSMRAGWKTGDPLSVEASGAALGERFDVRGRVELAKAAWRVDLASVRLGKTQGRANASGGMPLSAKPLALDAAFEVLDLESIGEKGGGKGAGKGDAGDLWEKQWLPSRLAFPDADIALRAARIVVPGGASAKVEVNAKTRGGRLEQAPFAVEFKGAAIRGDLAADLRQEAARVSATVEVNGLAHSLAGESAEDAGFGIKIGNASLAASSTGNRLRELAANAELRIAVRDAHAAMERRGKGPQLETTLSEALLSASPGAPTKLKASGRFADQPLSVEASTGPLAAWLPPGRAPFSFSASGRVAGLDVAAKGDLPSGGGFAEAVYDVRIGAARLDVLNALLNADLPSVGPFALEVVKQKSGKGEAAVDVKLALGESRVAGRISSRRTADRPAFDVELTSSLLRLEDLGTRALADESGQPKNDKRKPTKVPSADEVKHAQALLDEAHGALRKFDARLRVAVLRLTAAGHDVGRLDAAARLESGRLKVAPFRFDGPRGSTLNGDLDVNMATGDPTFTLAATLDRLPYGLLMKSVDPAHPPDGELSMKLKLSGHGALAAVAPTLEGAGGLVVYPSNKPSKYLDKMGGGLMHNLGLTLEPDKNSSLNCGVATFDIAGGRAKSTALMFDSTRMRAAGELEVDFTNGELHGQIASKSKRPELFAAQLPIVIGGTLSAPKLSLASGAVAVTATRYVLFAYAYLFDAVTTTATNLAEDGRPDCTAAYDRLAK